MIADKPDDKDSGPGGMPPMGGGMPGMGGMGM
jgi:chaperonin GroEL